MTTAEWALRRARDVEERDDIKTAKHEKRGDRAASREHLKRGVTPDGGSGDCVRAGAPDEGEDSLDEEEDRLARVNT
jgi:hypothetical protein